MGKTAPLICFLIPIYNEAENIQELINSILLHESRIPEFTIVFVNDGSTDNSKEILINQKNIIHLSLPVNKGPGAAFQEGFNYILTNLITVKYIITVEGDNTADLTILPQLIDATKSHELVLASVYSENGKLDATSWWRLILSKIANKMSRIILNIPQKTLTSFYRIYDVALLKRIKENYEPFISQRGFACKVELLAKANYLNASIVEIPTTLFSKKRKGKSKMNLMNTIIEHLKFLFLSHSIKNKIKR
jgi:dolichol-phosphate mannosyltransferase